MDPKNLPKKYNRYGRWSKVSKAKKAYIAGFIPSVTMIRGNRSNSFFRLDINENGETSLFVVKDTKKPPYHIGKVIPGDIKSNIVSIGDNDEWSNKLAMQKKLLYKLDNRTIEMLYTVSSVSPLIKYDFKNTQSFSLGDKIKIDNLGYEYLFVPGIGKIKLSDTDSINTEKISGNYVLLFHGRPGDFPILISFNKRPGLLKWGMSESASVSGIDYIQFFFRSSEFSCYIGLLNGAALLNTISWIERIPSKEIKKAEILSWESLSFPINYSEESIVNWGEKKIIIKRRYQFLTSLNEFGIEPNGLAACPPYVFYPHSRGNLLNPETINIFSLYGLTKFARGESIVFELPLDPTLYTDIELPSKSDLKSPLVKEIQKRIDKEANKLMAEWNNIPADDNPYKFCGVAQQLLASYPLLNKTTQIKALAWVKNTIEWYFTNDHYNGNRYYYFDENFNFFTIYGHGDPRDIDCLFGMVFACIGQYVRHSKDFNFLKTYYSKYYRMFDSYFNQVIDPMTGNTFCQPDGKLNWISDTLEAYIGLNYVVKHANILNKDDLDEASKISAIYRCAAIGQLYGWEIAKSIPGYKEYNLDPNYNLKSSRCLHTWEGFKPLPYRREEQNAFWEMAASLWPISPELCILYRDIEYSDGLKKLLEAYETNWPHWYERETIWEGNLNKDDYGGGFKANALITMLAFFNMKSQEELWSMFKSANRLFEREEDFKWDTWKEFTLSMIINMTKK
ncbi:hypothetical protein KJ656_07645 [bacterium]|nr:hypothetical protein [bacterium]